jgi:F-type H+-transporting ATPase subunit a
MAYFSTNTVFGIMRLVLSFFFAMTSIFSFGNDGHNADDKVAAIHENIVKKEEAKEFKAVDMIMHHIKDAHDFHIFGEGHSSVSLPLPIILYTKNGLVAFLSSDFHHDDHGKVVVEKLGQKFVKAHEHIYYASSVPDSHGSYLKSNDKGDVLNNAPLDFSITKNVFSMLFSVILLLCVFISVASAYSKRGVKAAPKGFQNLMETLIIFVRDEIARPNIDATKVNKFLPYLLSVFFFIWINNLIGLVPFFPFSANLTGNIGFTFALALLTMIITNVSGNSHYWGHIFWMPGIPVPMKIIMAPIELVGVIAKPFALMVRLFANITAGHIIILSLISLIFTLGAGWSALSEPLVLFMNVLELLVAFIQAYVFTLLSALFIGQSTERAHH